MAEGFVLWSASAYEFRILILARGFFLFVEEKVEKTEQLFWPRVYKKNSGSGLSGSVYFIGQISEKGLEQYVSLMRWHVNIPVHRILKDWQWVFPAQNRSTDPRSGQVMRHHVGPSVLQKAVKRAVGRAGIRKRIRCHTLRHSFATHMLEHEVHIRVV